MPCFMKYINIDSKDILNIIPKDDDKFPYNKLLYVSIFENKYKIKIYLKQRVPGGYIAFKIFLYNNKLHAIKTLETENIEQGEIRFVIDNDIYVVNINVINKIKYFGTIFLSKKDTNKIIIEKKIKLHDNSKLDFILYNIKSSNVCCIENARYMNKDCDNINEDCDIGSIRLAESSYSKNIFNGYRCILLKNTDFNYLYNITVYILTE